MSNSDFEQFLTALGAFESGIDTTQTQTTSWMQYLQVFDPNRGNVDPNSVNLSDPNDLAELQYHVHNTLGFLGKYQFGEPLLIDLGYYSPAPTGYYGTTATNEWQGTWTGKNGVDSKEEFMTNVQELAIREAFAMNMGVINQYLNQAGKTIDDFLGHEFTYTRFGEAHIATVTMSGILASAHLQGPGGVAQLLLHNIASSDEYGTNILFYMDKFGGYHTPFGTNGDDFLVGSDYSETFMGEGGHNEYETGGGNDKIIIAQNITGNDVIQDFDIARDVISLTKFPGLTFADLSITALNNNAVIHFPNGQTVTLNNVDASQISANQFVSGPYKIMWNAGSGDTIIENFNLQHDLIDLNYAFASNNLALYEENGSAVIDVIGNNQRIILAGIELDELSPFHFIKAPTDFAQVHFGINSDHTPPVVDPGDANTGNDNPADGGDNNNQQGTMDGDVFAYTWNWGARDVIQGFDATEDKIDLQNFWTSFDRIQFYDNANGDAVIDLTTLNNQTITLADVSVQQLSSANFIGVTGTMGIHNEPNNPPANEPTDPSPPSENDAIPPEDTTGSGDSYVFTWKWGAAETINNFDVGQDVIDLKSFWSSYSQFSIYDNPQGNAVIDLSQLNNQTITIQGVSSAELSAKNIVGVAGTIDQALTGHSIPPSDHTDPPDTGTVTDVISHPVNSTNLVASDAVQDVFNFTWSWGSQNVIDGFNPTQDTVDLSRFWTTNDQVDIYNNAQGDAVIDLSALNNQTITLLGVNADDLNQDNVIF
ncbi:hypothetical protein Loa_02569 [Legionella oakridgensis ATCC 33761 = DSM 21215]|uniref:Uncharacterized protein n=3 Tax=Legionella oakridgensis TaxID=29423 RepID=W0BH99_9GAMM|nr:hypothetical protein Loa_02569 [Legionella oakridgensis ATCC 33761 = DSM 21215]ETO92381.1 hypothetical protein LOR_66c18410 [Legionella oakridgensis RV-2-2007]KTD42545.1 hypothetical protein Loak_0739 [Legionella oakridgensis]STY21081.1 Uncharacterised protein [Legionella longbeachae]